MSLIHINRNPGARELRWFGVLFLGCFSLVSAVLRWGYGASVTSTVVFVAAALFVAAYYAWPRLRRPLYLGWMYAVMPIGATVSIVMLAATYFLVVTPIGLLVRLFSHDPMTRRFEPRATTYWVRRPESPPPERYFRQF